MLKAAILCILLWHEACKFSGNAQSFTENSAPHLSPIVLPNINDSVMQTDPKVAYIFNASHQIFYVNGPLLGKLGLGGNMNSIDHVPKTDYLVTNGIGSHKVHRRPLKWNKARQICVDEGGHLAVIRSESEEKIVLQMMTDLSVGDAWIGFHDQFEEGDWISVLDEPLGETGWARWSKKITPNPDNYKGKQNCARLLKDGGGMDDDTCDIAKSFVCKI